MVSNGFYFLLPKIMTFNRPGFKVKRHKYISRSALLTQHVLKFFCLVRIVVAFALRGSEIAINNELIAQNFNAS